MERPILNIADLEYFTMSHDALLRTYFGVMTSFPEDTDGQTTSLRFVGRVDNSLDYWDGE